MIGPTGFNIPLEWSKLDGFTEDATRTKLKRFTEHLRWKCGFQYAETETIILE